MIEFGSIFNHNSLNIFVDASITNRAEGYIGCPGFISVVGTGTILETGSMITRNTTNNNSEIKAIRLGVQQAIKYNHKYTNLNIFSDSQLCIYGLRDRVFKWVQMAMRNNSDILLTAQGDEVKNQDVFMEIIYMILDNNISINLFHQKGHVNVNKQSDMQHAKRVFCTSNRLFTTDMKLIEAISYYNDQIDKMTKTYLFENIRNKSLEAISFKYGDFNTNKYRRLIGG